MTDCPPSGGDGIDGHGTDGGGTDENGSPTATLVRIVESAADVAIDPESATTTVVGRDGDRDREAGRDGDPGPEARLPPLLADAESIVGVVPRIDRELSDRLIDAGSAELNARIVLTGRARRRLTGPVRSVVRSRLADRGVDFYTHDGDSPVGVLLVDDRAVVGLFDDRGLAAVLLADDPAIREWVAKTCRRYLDAAEPL
ncbi:hypothetical protein J2751_000417 [Halorubrum alkaliphilum]|uniref:Methanogenesis regulatory protein FilR1 middle domain-containing protein n=1 Tax=Halorubrum alkaliphilum TaxID=261290 RepID=A0A8T4GAH1_9EURY|nr:hypothetical protein [Halorubrum alkaliphilum]MBP1921428.1 hypothetical protein [Halorubrum alkaliphilum]